MNFLYGNNKDEKAIYNTCKIVMVGPKAEINECEELLKVKTARREINVNKHLVDTLNLLVATYDLYCDKYPNAADIIKYAMDVAHTGILCKCPRLTRLDKNLEGVEVVLNFINNIMIKNKGVVKWGETYFSYQAPESDKYLKQYPYKFKETYKLFNDTIYPDTAMYYIYKLEQKSIEELFDNGEVNSDKIDYMAGEYYNGDYDVKGVFRRITSARYNNDKKIKNDKRYTSYFDSEAMADYLYSKMDNYNNKSVKVLTVSYDELRSIPLDMVLALSFKFDNSYFSIQYISDSDIIKTYVFNNGNIVDNNIPDELKMDFLINEIGNMLSNFYFMDDKLFRKYSKDFRYIMLNNFNSGMSFEEFIKRYYYRFSLEDGDDRKLSKCLIDTTKPRKMFFGKSTNKYKEPKKLYKKTYSEKAEKVYKNIERPEPLPFGGEYTRDKITIQDYDIMKYREEKLKDFK